MEESLQPKERDKTWKGTDFSWFIWADSTGRLILTVKRKISFLAALKHFSWCFWFDRNPEVLETFNFLENADDSDEEEYDEGDIMEDVPDRSDKRRIKKHKIKVCGNFSGNCSEWYNDLKVIFLSIWLFV